MASLETVVYPKLVIFGDSIVQYSTRPGGFASLFAEKYERQVDVVVRGFSGYNSDHYPVIIPSVLRGLGPGPIDTLVVFIGTNDATIESSFQYVPLERTLENADKVFEMLYPATKRLIIVPPAYCENSERDDRRDEDFEVYYKKLTEKAKSFIERVDDGPDRIRVIDSRKVLANVDGKKRNGKLTNYDPDALLDDGLHFTPFGYRKMFEAITAELTDIERSWYQKLAPLEAFMHLSVPDQKALLKGHITIESEKAGKY